MDLADPKKLKSYDNPCKSQFVVTTTRTHATITIKHAETIDCGQYTVKLSNEVSEVSADFTVGIRGEQVLAIRHI